MDISDTLAPKSDQLDAVDLLGGPRTFTITDVTRGNAEQPVNVHLADFPRVWRPGKSMRRVLAYCWGADASRWKGRRVTLYCDDAVMFGGETVGGTRISHLSHIDKRQSIPLLIKRGKSAAFTVEPLAAGASVEDLRREWRTADPTRRAAIEAEIAAKAAADPPGTTPAVEDRPVTAAEIMGTARALDRGDAVKGSGDQLAALLGPLGLLAPTRHGDMLALLSFILDAPVEHAAKLTDQDVARCVSTLAGTTDDPEQRRSQIAEMIAAGRDITAAATERTP